MALLTMALLTIAPPTMALLTIALPTMALLTMALLTMALLTMALLTMAPLTMALLTTALLTLLQAELLAECPETAPDYRGGVAILDRSLHESGLEGQTFVRSVRRQAARAVGGAGQEMEVEAEAEVEAEVEAPSSERFAQAASRHGPMPNVLAPTPILALGRPHVLPKELRHARLAAQQGSARQLARRARLRDELGQVR